MRQCDVTVIGGSLYGCMAAMEAARNGASVVLVETGTFLGSEFTKTLRPWIKYDGNECDIDKDLNEILFSGNLNRLSHESYEIPLYIGEIKKNLMKRLIENGVIILFMSQVVGVIKENNNAKGILIGTKNGLKVFYTKSLIDATVNSKAVWPTGERKEYDNKEIIVRRTLEYFKVKDTTLKIIDVPSELGIHDNIIELHKGKYRKDQYFVDFALKFDFPDGSYSEKMKMETEARKKSILLAKYLKQNTDAFKNAALQQSSPVLCFSQHNNNEKNNNMLPEYKDQGCSNIVTFCKNAGLGVNPDFNEVTRYADLAKKAGGKAVQLISKENHCNKPGKTELYLGGLLQDFDCSWLKPDWQENMGIDIYSCDMSLIKNIPVVDKYDIVVCGGGTAGAPAAIAAASMEAKVAVVEDFWGLGGTKTLGGVARYYHGYRGGFTAALDKSVLNMSQEITDKADAAHIESKMLAMHSEVCNKGISLYMETKTVGAIVKDSCIKGVIIANSDGLGIITCDIAIDATGDGDVAAFAGAAYSYGSPRDGTVQTFNHNGFVRGSFNDLGFIDNRTMSDVMRGLRIAHERNDIYDFRPFLVVREARRIEGDYQINMSDILFKSSFKDVISIAMTDCDPHGINVSLISRLGYMPLRSEEACVNIPYRACLPKGIEGLLISAKAISATKDASNYLRVSADIQNQGYAVGTAAALAHKHRVMPRYINVSELQEILVKKDIISEDLLRTKAVEPLKTEDVVNKLIEGDEEAFLKIICTKKEAVLELLEDKFVQDSDNLTLAKALAWFGSNSGVSVLLNELDNLWTKEDGKFHMDLNPIYADGTVMSGFLKEPDVYWKINQLIVLLGMAGDKAALKQICSIADETESGGPHYIIPQAYMYGKIRIDWCRVPHYDRLMSLAFCIERLADNKASPPLERLLEKPYIGGFACKNDPYAGGNYLSAHLEVTIIRALARCGSKKGALLLVDYMEDVQAVFSEHAYNELREITGQDFGKDSAKWREWIQGQEVLAARPFTKLFYEPLQ